MQMDCSKVLVRGGAYAACKIHKGDIVEYGIVQRLENIFGHENPSVFSWSEDDRVSVWAMGSGASAFYNTSVTPNSELIRYLTEDRFEIFALRDIHAGDKLTLEYVVRSNPGGATEGKKTVLDAAAAEAAAAAAAAGIVPQTGEEVRWC
jgi:hypothetical protein